MTTTINASNSGSGGLLQTADASGILALQTAGANAVTIDTSQNATFNSTGAMTLPTGNTAQRPSSPVLGMTRFNTTTGNPEWYASTGWIQYSDVAPYNIDMYAWGGGGGGGGNSGMPNAPGGGGGAASGSIAVTPLAAYTIVIGGGGQAQASGAGAGPVVPGGGGQAGSTGYGGQGGGYSGMFSGTASQANAILIAGGGGGGAWDQQEGGGAGGGTTGATGTNGGGGGTQSAGGTAISGGQDGTALQGGIPTGGDNGGGGAGGGGYWGGGAGSGSTGHPGGGGSGYYKSAIVTSPVLTAGSGATPGDSSNALRGSYGNGGSTYSVNGTQGVFIIRYLGSQKGTGGTVTSIGGYTYHTFTTAGTFTA